MSESFEDFLGSGLAIPFNVIVPPRKSDILQRWVLAIPGIPKILFTSSTKGNQMDRTMFKAACFLSLAFISGCNQPNEDGGPALAADIKPGGMASAKKVPQVDGFKDAKFGMPLSAMEALGYHCVVEKLEVSDDKELSFDDCTKDSTLFGLPARATAHFDDDGVLITVSVKAIDTKPIDLASLFTNAIGPPRLFQQRSPFDLSTTTTSMWLSDLGSSIVILRTEGLPGALTTAPMEENDGSVPVDAISGTQYEQTVLYYSASQTALVLKRLEETKVNAESDF